MSTGLNDALGERFPARTPAAYGYAELSHFGLIHISGADAQTFLHGQFSSDVAGLAAGRAQYGSYNTSKGRMLASFLLWRDDTGYFMHLPRVLCAVICKRLSMYILRSKVSVRDVSDEFCGFGVADENTESALRALFEALPSTPLSVVLSGGYRLLRLDARRVQIVAPNAEGERVVR